MVSVKPARPESSVAAPLERTDSLPMPLAVDRVPRTRWGRVIRHRLEAPSPLLKQAPVGVMFLIAVILAVWIPAVPIVDPGALAAGFILALGATIFALILTVQPTPLRSRMGNVVPALDFLAIETLRYSTGGNKSIFGVLVMVPAIWMATNAGRRYIGWTILGVAIVFLLPFVLMPSQINLDPTGPLRGFYVVIAYGIAAVVVNELSRQSRMQFDVVRAREITFEGELSSGRIVQQALFPLDGSPVAGYEVAGTCVPSKVVGGDFYDWYAVPGGIGFTLGDVMGKGVGAGMIAAATLAVVRSARDEADPVIAIERADVCLSSDFATTNAFATMFHARVHSADGLVRYVDAGHGLSLHVHADHTWERIVSKHLPVGLGLGQEWATRELQLEEGDMLVSFSDGILDLYEDSLVAIDAVGRLAAAASSPADLIDALSVVASNGTNPDDVTVIAVRRSVTAA